MHRRQPRASVQSAHSTFASDSAAPRSGREPNQHCSPFNRARHSSSEHADSTPSMSSDKLQAMEPVDDFDADGADSDDGSTQHDKQQRRKRRRKDASAAAAAEAAQTGEKDHLFFSLKADPASSSAASTLVIRGFSCTLHADSPVAAALRSEAHLQFLDTAPPRVAVENADDSEAVEEPLPTSLEKYDVRLIAPVAEWRQANVDEERDAELDEPAPEIAEEDHAALAAKVSAPFDPTLVELANERLSKEEYVQLHRERYADWWSSLKNQPAASDAAAALGADTAMSDAAPSAPSMDRAINEEEDPATLEEETRKRRLMAEKGQLWSFNYAAADDSAASTKPDAAASASGSSGAGAGAAADATRVAGAKRPPPPPPRKRGPPPPPPRGGKASADSSQADAAVAAAVTSVPSAATAAIDKPVSAPFRPFFTVPAHLVAPLTLSEHRLIVRTVRFILSLGAAGPPQEVLMKVKHAHDARFWFLNYDHPLHSYYHWVKANPEIMDRPDTIDEAAAATAAAAASPPSATPPSSTPPAAVDAAASTARLPPGMRAPPGMRKPTSSEPLGAVATPAATPPVSMPVAAPAAAAASAVAVGWPSVAETPAAADAPVGSLAGLLSGYGDSDDEDDAAKPISAAAAAAPSHLPPLPLPPLPLPPRPVAVPLPLPPLPPVLPIPPSLLPLLPAPPAPIPPAAMLKVIHKLCAYLHKHGPSFERLTAARERTNPAFEFLKAESVHQAYFQWAKYIQPMVALEEKSSAEREAKQKQAQQPQAETAVASEPPQQPTPPAAAASTAASSSSAAPLSALARSIAAAKQRALEIMQAQRKGGPSP